MRGFRELARTIGLLALFVPLMACGRDWKIQGKDALQGLVQNYLAYELQIPVANLSVNILRTYPSELKGPIVLIPMTSLPKRGGITTLPLNLSGARGYVTAQFDVFSSVVVLKEPVTAHESLEGHVALERRNTRFLPWDALKSLDAVKNKETRFQLNDGEVLVPREIMEVQLIHTGDLCAVLVEKGLVEIRTQGQALGSGRAGDFIPVRLLDSPKTIHAKVADRGLVELDMENLP